MFQFLVFSISITGIRSRLSFASLLFSMVLIQTHFSRFISPEQRRMPMMVAEDYIYILNRGFMSLDSSASSHFQSLILLIWPKLKRV